MPSDCCVHGRRPLVRDPTAVQAGVGVAPTHSPTAAAPASDLWLPDPGRAAARWQALDEYGAKPASEAVYGYQQWPKFASARVDFAALHFIPLYGIDWSSIQLTK